MRCEEDNTFPSPDWSELKMTIIGAMLCGDHVVMASDSYALNVLSSSVAIGRSGVTKLWRVAKRRIVWGYFGPQSIGDEFRAWIDGSPEIASARDWDTLRNLTAIRLATMHGERKAFADLAHEAIDPDQHVWALFAGIVADKQRILLVSPDGQWAYPEPSHFVSAPSPRAAADAVLVSQGHRLSVDTMRLVMESVAEVFVGLEGPIQMWKITPDGAEQLQ